MPKIKKIKAREILDSRGNPTVEVKLETEDGVFSSAVPSGASTGKNEAVELRDNESERYNGKGVLKAVGNINKIIAERLTGFDVLEQEKIDKAMIEMDKTENKSNLGANAILGVSLAVFRAGAAARKVPLYQYISQFSEEETKMPQACFNIINGGVHAGNDLALQEFMVIPQNKFFADNLRTASEIYYQLKKIIKVNFGKQATNIGDEGGFAPPLSYPEQALSLINDSLKEKYPETKIGIDCAASQFYSNGEYNLKKVIFTRNGLISYYEQLIFNYPIIFLEDPFSEEDWIGFQEINKKLKGKIFVVGDDLLTTNPKRMKIAKEKKACSGIIIKPNQIGTISETIEAIKLAKSFGWKIIISHRSGETCDDFIADLAVGVGADFIKSGAPARGERVAKYNRLLKIEEELVNI